jgi:hypothetical protein
MDRRVELRFIRDGRYIECRVSLPTSKTSEEECLLGKILARVVDEDPAILEEFKILMKAIIRVAAKAAIGADMTEWRERHLS